MVLVDADGITMSRPGRPLFTELRLTLHAGDRLGIVGLNGCGKSTLLRVLAGGEEPEAGVVRRGRGVRVAVLDQDPVLPPGPARAAVGDGWEAAAVLDRLGMGSLADADTATLSGGQRKRVALARTLVTECDLLVLDEPTNHLDIDAIAWLEDRLAEHTGGLVLVTHDRHLLDRVTTRILELDRGRGYLHEGGYEAYLAGRAEREEQAVAAEATRRILARRELAWLRRGAPARTRKPKARVEAATRTVSARPEAAARRADLDLAAAGGGRAAAPAGPSDGRGWGAAGVLARHPGTPRLGDQVIELHGVGHRWGEDQPWLLHDVELLLDDRERLGVVGANGTGKSTLLDILAGRRVPAVGRVVTGPTVRLGVFDQHGTTLDLDARVRDAVAGPDRQPDGYDAALLEQFWFDADAQWAPIRLLSGGERRRLQLLLVLAAKPNVLLLDEPTNDLDVDTLRVLEEFLDDWPGALVVVSHDRAFLERTVSDVVVLDGTGTVARRPGGYATWEDERRARRRRGRAGPADERPAHHDDGPPAASASASASSSPSSSASSRSPSTLRHLVREADKVVARLQRRHDELAAELEASGHDRTALATLGVELATVAAELAEAEERWLDLAAELEAAEAARRARR